MFQAKPAAGSTFPKNTMAMSGARPQQAASPSPSTHAPLPHDSGLSRAEHSPVSGIPAEPPRKASGYGLPCAKCRLYYPADLDVCPTCHHTTRVAPVVPGVRPKVAHTVPEVIPDSAAVEQEREEFLRQFKSQLLQAHAEVENVAESFCVLGEHHASEPASAEICKSCYDHLQEHLDVAEAALHMDLKEAAQIVYEAVWADPSDPGKTYQNAANALLTELRKRAGMTTLLGPFQPLQH